MTQGIAFNWFRHRSTAIQPFLTLRPLEHLTITPQEDCDAVFYLTYIANITSCANSAIFFL